MRTRPVQGVYGYWNEIRGARLAPRRFEIEPARLSPYLPDAFILERYSDSVYLFRIAGTRICDRFAGEFRGRDFASWFEEASRPHVLERLREICSTGGVGLFELSARPQRRPHAPAVSFELILLPLFHNGTQLDRVLGVIVPTDGWLSAEPELMAAPRLVTESLIWPDGRPRTLIEAADLSAPFLPPPAAARTVRADKRRFRVYDGGR